MKGVLHSSRAPLYLKLHCSLECDSGRTVSIRAIVHFQIAFMYQKPPGMDAVEKAAAAKVSPTSAHSEAACSFGARHAGQETADITPQNAIPKFRGGAGRGSEGRR